MPLEDQTLSCRECQQPFEYSTRDQEYFEMNGWNPPIRCRDCREAKKAKFGAQSKGIVKPAP